MSTTSTVGKNALLAGLKAQMEAAGAAASATLVYLSGITTVAAVTISAAAPSGGAILLTSTSGSTVATGTLTSVELRDRGSSTLRTYTIGAVGSGRDITLSVSGSGVSVSGQDIVVSQAGVSVGIATITETAT